MNKLFFLLLTTISVQLNAQFFQSFGFMGGVTACKEKWWLQDNNTNLSTKKTKNTYRLNGEVFLEMINSDYIRWRSELQYNQKGFTEKTQEQKFKNKLDYVCWNNFLIFRTELFSGIPYFLAGPRIEYNLIQNTPSPAIVNSFKKLHFSWSVGAGWEFIVFSNAKPFIELHYNPDATFAYSSDYLDTKNKAWELRVGIKFLLNQESCPPVFK